MVVMILDSLTFQAKETANSKIIFIGKMMVFAFTISKRIS